MLTCSKGPDSHSLYMEHFRMPKVVIPLLQLEEWPEYWPENSILASSRSSLQIQ